MSQTVKTQLIIQNDFGWVVTDCTKTGEAKALGLGFYRAFSCGNQHTVLVEAGLPATFPCVDYGRNKVHCDEKIMTRLQ